MSTTVEETTTNTIADDTVVGLSPAKIAFRRFRRDPIGIVSLSIIVLLLTIVCLAAPICAWLKVDPLSGHQELLDGFNMPIGAFGGMSAAHPLGVEPVLGRDLLSRLLFGAQISFTVSFVTTFLTIFFGVIVGIVAGYKGGRTDAVIGRVIDFLMAFPGFFMILALSQPAVTRARAMGLTDDTIARVVVLVIFLVFFGWTGMARLIRGQVLSLRERDFIAAAEAVGAPTRRIVFKEMLPNLWPPIIIFASNALPGFLSAEAAFSFLGIGVQPPAATWGSLLAAGVDYWDHDPSFFWIPGILLFITVLAFNLFGDSLRDALDPKSSK